MCPSRPPRCRGANSQRPSPWHRPPRAHPPGRGLRQLGPNAGLIVLRAAIRVLRVERPARCLQCQAALPPPGPSGCPAWAAVSPCTWLAPGTQPECARLVGLPWGWEALVQVPQGRPAFTPGRGKGCTQERLGRLSPFPPPSRQAEAPWLGVFGTTPSTPRPALARWELLAVLPVGAAESTAGPLLLCEAPVETTPGNAICCEPFPQTREEGCLLCDCRLGGKVRGTGFPRPEGGSAATCLALVPPTRGVWPGRPRSVSCLQESAEPPCLFPRGCHGNRGGAAPAGLLAVAGCHQWGRRGPGAAKASSGTPASGSLPTSQVFPWAPPQDAVEACVRCAALSACPGLAFTPPRWLARRP